MSRALYINGAPIEIMSNLSNIGFNVANEEDFENIAKQVYELGTSIESTKGTYIYYSDSSGAELWLQLNKNNEFCGLNPHFNGKSKRAVCITAEVKGVESELDGGLHAWANPTEVNDPESGMYPFIFDVPDFLTIGKLELPQSIDIQLSAFAQELECYSSEEEYDKNQLEEPKWASQSFMPSGLFSPDEGEDPSPPEAYGIFTGIIREHEIKTNELTGSNYYWLLVDTLGGEIDVVADAKLFKIKPVENGVITGQFWLSGQLASEPKIKKKKGILFNLFGNRS